MERLRLRVRVLCPLSLLLVAFSSCETGGELAVVSYNVQNLFDSVEDGDEYPAFRHSGGYTPDRYFRRLVSLAETLRTSSVRAPDLIVLQEIEGSRVVADLLYDHLRSPRYHATVVPVPGRMGVAVLSRKPPSGVRTHQSVTAVLQPVDKPPGPTDPGSAPVIDSGSQLVTESGDGFYLVHQSRLVVEVEVETAIGPILLFGCHWKSQSGGEEETEPLRVQEAALLRARLANLSEVGNASRLVLVVGDLNEDVEEYRQHDGRYPTALMPRIDADTEPCITNPRAISTTASASEAAINDEVVLFSPWLAADVPARGSYYHAGAWERLDQVLCGPAPTGELFCTIRTTGPDYLTDEEGKPVRYQPRTGAGYSDHLPVLITICTTRPSQ